MPIPLISPIPTLPNGYNYLQISHTSLEPVRGQGYNQALQVVTQVPTYFNVLLIINNLIFKLVFNGQWSMCVRRGDKQWGKKSFPV